MVNFPSNIVMAVISHEDTLRLLINEGLDINKKYKISKFCEYCTPLEYACKYDLIQCIINLKKFGVNLHDDNSIDIIMRTANERLFRKLKIKQHPKLQQAIYKFISINGCKKFLHFLHNEKCIKNYDELLICAMKNNANRIVEYIVDLNEILITQGSDPIINWNYVNSKGESVGRYAFLCNYTNDIIKKNTSNNVYTDHISFGIRNGLTNKNIYTSELISTKNEWFKIIHNKRFHNIIPIMIESYVNCTDANGNSAFFYYITNTKKYNYELIDTFIVHKAKFIINHKEFAKIKTKSIDLAHKYPGKFVFHDVFGNDLAMAIINNDMIYYKKITIIFELINQQHINWDYRNYNNESLAEVINNSLNIDIPVKKKLIRKIAFYYPITERRVVENFREIIDVACSIVFCLSLNCPLCRAEAVTIKDIETKRFTCIICMDIAYYNVKLSCNHDEICKSCTFAMGKTTDFYSLYPHLHPDWTQPRQQENNINWEYDGRFDRIISPESNINYDAGFQRIRSIIRSTRMPQSDPLRNNNRYIFLDLDM